MRVDILITTYGVGVLLATGAAIGTCLKRKNLGIGDVVLFSLLSWLFVGMVLAKIEHNTNPKYKG